MVSSHSLTELQLLKSGMALSISGGLLKLQPGRETDGGGRGGADGGRGREMDRETEGLVGGSLKMSKESKAVENAGTTREEGGAEGGAVGAEAGSQYQLKRQRAEVTAALGRRLLRLD